MALLFHASPRRLPQPGEGAVSGGGAGCLGLEGGLGSPLGVTSQAAHPVRWAGDQEMKVMYLEEQLHQLCDGLHPNLADALKRIADQEITIQNLQREVSESHEAAHKSSLRIAQLRGVIAEQDARTCALQEEHEGLVRHQAALASRDRDDAARSFYATATTPAPPSPGLQASAIAMVPSPGPATASLMSLRCSLDSSTHDFLQAQSAANDLASENSALREELAAVRRDYTADVDALKAKLVSFAGMLQSREKLLKESSEAQLRAEAEAAKARQTLELTDHEAEAVKAEAAASARHAGLAKTGAEEKADALREELAGVRGELAEVKEKLADGSFKAAAEVDRLLAACDKRWQAVVERMQEDVDRQAEQVSLSVAREHRKNQLLQEYHAALTLVEEDRQEM